MSFKPVSNTILSIAITVLLSVTLALAENCQTIPNYESGAYTYIVCNGTDVDRLETTREFCKKKGADAVTYPNYEEYKFIISQINETYNKKTFKYNIGMYQRVRDDRFNPETGDFVWIDDEETVVTNKSKTYWQPLTELILYFDSQTLPNKQIASWLLDLDGNIYPSMAIGARTPSKVHNGDVICSKKGVPPTPSSTAESEGAKPGGSAAETKDDEGFQYWIVITVAAVVIVIGVVLAATIYCCYRRKQTKKANSQKFQKVPQNDYHQTPTQCQV